VKTAFVTSFFNQRLFHLYDGGQAHLLLLSVGLGGEGGEYACVRLVAMRRWCPWSSPCAEHTTTVVVAVILGRKGSPFSTSCPWIHRRSSPHLGSQVVRPQRPRCCQRLECLAGEEHASNLLFDLGRKVWRSLVSGGGASDVLDCVLQISFMVFSAKKRLSSNVRFIRASDVKSPM
jgi:hypothetical protein